MDTLTTASRTATVTVTDAKPGKIACSGVFAGASLNIFYALAGADTVFAPLTTWDTATARAISAMPGTKIKGELIGGTASTSVNFEVTVTP
jgi:hypothetical protein